MTSLTKIEAIRELSQEEISCIAGGYPSAQEQEIMGLVVGEDLTQHHISEGTAWAYAGASNIWVGDFDLNGYWDYAEFHAGGETYVYDTTTNSWRERNDNEPHPTLR